MIPTNVPVSQFRQGIAPLRQQLAPFDNNRDADEGRTADAVEKIEDSKNK